MPEDRPAWKRVIPGDAPAPGPRSTVVDVPEDRAHDPREQEAWFQRLPPHAREELREERRAADRRSASRKGRRKSTTKAYVLESIVLFLVLEGAFMGATVPSFLAAIVFGAAAGTLCALVRATTIFYGAVFLGAYLGFGALAGSMHVAYYFISSPLPLCLGAALGRIHMLERFDGSEL